MNTVIFDMDGLLIDSEPFWQEAGKETLQIYGAVLEQDQYDTTTGLRTREWIDWWFQHFDIDKKYALDAEAKVLELAIAKIHSHAIALPGVEYILDFFKAKQFRIGLATSSPELLIKVVVEKLGIEHMFDGFSSAENLVHGKPHPEVYLDCARTLNVNPLQCICFEDSVNGMIAAKAARMKCAVIPFSEQRHDKRFGLADLQLSSLLDFTDYQLDHFN